MHPALSTYVFLQQRLQTSLLDAMRASGASTIEVFAARHHFDYTDRAIVRDIASWFRDTGTNATLHQPIFSDGSAAPYWSRHVPQSLNLIDPEKSRRIDAMDEIKRALESAEQIPFSAITLHLGLKDDPWNLRALDNSLTAIEHVKAFAQPLGVRVLLENLQNEVTTPEHLLEIIRVGHFDSVGIALDLGHAHIPSATAGSSPNSAIDHAFEILHPRIMALNLHDNNGLKDDHFWPNISNVTKLGTMDWQNVTRHIATLPATTPAILEIHHEPNETPASVTTKASAFFSHQSRLTEHLLTP